jgi:MOSC domain-containing protein YiiM
MAALVISVHSKDTHAFSKDALAYISIVAGQGVEGDAHSGVTVQHRSRVAKDPTQPNLRQVHLIHRELLDELQLRGLPVRSGQMGENITTTGLPLLNLSAGTLLRIGSDAVLKITGLRNPCSQIEEFMPGLLAAVLDRSADGALIRKAGVMAVALESGVVFPGDEIEIIFTPEIHVPLQPV